MTFWDFATANPATGVFICIVGLMVLRSLGYRAQAIVGLLVAQRAISSKEKRSQDKKDA